MEDFIDKLYDEPVMVNKWNSSKIKSTLNDLYMTEVEGCTEIHSLSDLKLWFGLLLTVIGSVVTIYSFKIPFNDSKQLVAVGASLYFIVQSLLFASLTYFTIPTLYRGNYNDGKSIWIQTDLRLPEAKYEISIIDNPSKKLSFPNISKAKPSLNASWPVQEIIREDGMVDPDEFCRLMDEFLSIYSSLDKKE